MKVYVDLPGIKKGFSVLANLLERVLLKLDAVLTKEQFMSTMQEVLDSLTTIKQEAGDYIAKRDAADAARDVVDASLNQRVSDLISQHVTDVATATALQAQIDLAVAAAAGIKAQLAPPAPPPAITPPVVADPAVAVADATAAASAVAVSDSILPIVAPAAA